MKRSVLVLLIVLPAGILLIPSCYLGRTIDKPVSVYIDYTAMNAQTSTVSASPRYLNYKTIDAYKTEFQSALANETTFQKNVTVVQAPPADYTLRLTYFEVAESETKETVNDAASPYNGQSYNLTAINTKATFDVVQNGSKIGSYTAQADKAEKLTNNRNIQQMIDGSNKDHTQYREKLLPEDICVDLSQKCGRRTWNLFTQKLAKKMK